MNRRRGYHRTGAREVTELKTEAGVSMPIIPVTRQDDPRVAEYRNVPDGVLLRDKGLFIAEGRLVVRQLLTAPRVRPQSLLVTEAALATLMDVLPAVSGPPVYVAPQEVLNDIAGFNIHRGCLALGVRPPPIPLSDLVNPPPPERNPALRLCTQVVSRAVVLERVSNVDNVGGIFRSVAALGGDAVVLGPGCGDPFYRKAIRTSMGATLRVAFAPAEPWPAALGELTAAGFTLVALTPAPGADSLEDVAADLRARPRVALLLGAEGEGLSSAALASADLRVRIPMAPGIDSVNVTVAAAIALYRIV
jgi:tRNA G18 (ribose-2'-O)-methylase SpoU